MTYYSRSSSDDSFHLSEDEVLSAVPAPGPHNQEALSAAATEHLFLDNEAASSSDEIDSGTSAIMNSRAYQLEMLAESRKQNIVVAMDTGSGKTQVAVLRIKTELEKTAIEQIVWFLAPTVSLCAQQFEVLKSQIPAVQIKFLSGDDNVDSWSDKSVWNAVLLNVRVVVSTYQVLLDSLSHAFVRLDRLSLIVFDEAHNCVGKSPGSKIMTNFYHESKRKGRYVPHIMGLTASPTFGSNVKSISVLETTLDAVCKSPTIHRDDLLACVKKPELAHVPFLPEADYRPPKSLQSLRMVIQSLDISEDPFVLHLKAEGTDRSRRELQAVLESNGTYAQSQMASFGRQATQICREMGPWAAEYYIWEVITRFKAAVRSQNIWLDTWKDEEKEYLAKALSQVECRRPAADSLSRDVLSTKVTTLIEQLLQNRADTIGIIFARERATVGVLCHLLTSHDGLRAKYRVGAMVGTSQYQSTRKRDIWDLTRAEDLKSLHQFRSGRINLLVATSVLEEGIDVPACNLVFCFDKPPNLKSFIQRRGRARMRDSKLLMLLDESQLSPQGWEVMEWEMKRQYEDQERTLEHLQEIETTEEAEGMKFVVEKTGATLDLDNAKQHLDHLCRILSPGEFIDWRPDYILKVLDDTYTPDLMYTVVLPSYLPSDVREAKSQFAWKSEKNAAKDAAFQAYKGLYNAGLVNDNLLPFKPDDFVPGVDKRVAILQVNGLLNAWSSVAKAWKDGKDLRVTRLLLKDGQGVTQGEYEMALPAWVPGLQTIHMHLDYSTFWTLEFGDQLPVEDLTTQDHTAVLLALPFGHRWLSNKNQQVVRFSAVDAELSVDQIRTKDFVPGQMSADDLLCFIRDDTGCPYLYEGIIPGKPASELVQKTFYGFENAPEDVPYLTLKKWSRRSDFLHRPQSDPNRSPSSPKPYSRVYPVPMAKIDTIPAKYAQFGVMIPSILHRVETCLVAKELSSTLLRPLAIADWSLVLTAISAGSASEPTNYERLEFLGDSILKFSTTINVAALYPHWPERLLSFKKDSIVANSTLCEAAIKHGLDRFVLTKPFTGQKWRPVYVDEVLRRNDNTATRKMSTKTLADIVEALIGASMIDGGSELGLDKALKCMSIFLQKLKWRSIDDCRQQLYDIAPSNIDLLSTLQPLEQLIGYDFGKKSLLIQSMTHASCHFGNSLGSLERLEFIGDSVLDYVIVNRLFDVRPHLPHQTMHLLKTAVVNGDFIGFLSLEQAVHQEEVLITDTNNKKPNLQHTRFTLPLWKFMRFQSSAIGIEQINVENRYLALREAITDAMEHGKTYPWALLARLQLRKFYADIFESLLGAVWVDSGDMKICEQVVERFGILRYLDRIIRDGVHILHPKEELGHLADKETVQYLLSSRENDEREKELLCKVMVGNRLVVEVDGGLTRDEVKVRAAEAAVNILKAEQSQKKEKRQGH